ncbi:MAG: hypothetical protein WD055_04275 [Candidatus Dependentiae bacterium]
MVNIIKKIVSLLCISLAMGLYAADTPQNVHVVPWTYKRGKPVFLFNAYVGNERTLNILIELFMGKKYQEQTLKDAASNLFVEATRSAFLTGTVEGDGLAFLDSARDYIKHKLHTSFEVDGAAVFFPHVEYKEPSEMDSCDKDRDGKKIWIYAKKLYKIIDSNENRFVRKNRVCILSESLCKLFKTYKLSFDTAQLAKRRDCERKERLRLYAKKRISEFSAEDILKLHNDTTNIYDIEYLRAVAGQRETKHVSEEIRKKGWAAHSWLLFNNEQYCKEHVKN